MNKAILIGGVLDGEIVELENPADHQVLPFEVTWKKEDGEVGTTTYYYRISPIMGQERTWHIGRLDGVGFDEAITHVLQCYHITANKRDIDARFACHEI